MVIHLLKRFVTSLTTRRPVGAVAALPCATALIFFSCIGIYNPFNDLENAGALITTVTLSHGDTLSLFATESLSVQIKLKEHTDSLRLSAPANRLWATADTTLFPGDYYREPFVFYLSLTDTGRQVIRTEAFLDNGSVSADSLVVYVRSPLFQPPLFGMFGEPLVLSTPAVSDPGVLYNWSFGAGTRIVSPTAQCTTSIVAATAANRGELWVSAGVHRSPAIPFAFTLGDTTPPSIECLWPHISNDTVYTGDSVFVFALRITDRGTAHLDSVSIDGAPFTYVVGQDYHRVFPAMHLFGADNPLTVSAFALDKFAFNNTTRRTFTLVYADSLPRGEPFALQITNPIGPQGQSSVPLFPFAGIITTTRALPAVVALHISIDTIHHISIVNLDAVQTTWTRHLALPAQSNEITFRLVDLAGTDTFAIASRLMQLVAPESDTTPPHISTILCDGVPAQGHISRRAVVLLRARVTDQTSVVTAVTIGGFAAVADTGGWYAVNLNLTHGSAGNEIEISAFDAAANRSDSTVVIKLNRPAVFQGRPVSAYLITDSLYRDSVVAIDPDGDTVRFESHNTPPGLIVAPGGAITWVPGATDTGKHTITVRAWDNYEPSYLTWSVHIAPAGFPVTPLRLATMADHFPRFLDSDKDTLRVVLRKVPFTGVAPIRHTVRRSGSATPLMNASTDSVLLWAPSRTDSGWVQLSVFVADDFGGRDTIYPRIFVSGSNAPCSLSMSHSLNVLPNGSLDLGTHGATALLKVRIHDLDHPVTERHRLSVRLGGVVTYLDSALTDTFRVELDPLRLRPTDTLTITVTDRGNTSDTLTVIISNIPPHGFLFGPHRDVARYPARSRSSRPYILASIHPPHGRDHRGRIIPQSDLHPPFPRNPTPFPPTKALLHYI